MKKRLLENIFFYFSGFFIVSIFLIIAFIIASINLDKSVQKEAGLELESGTDRLEDMEDRIRMLNNVIIQDTTFNTLVYTDGTSAASVTAIKNLNSLYRNLSIIANDVSYIFTLFDSSDIFLSSSDTTFDFTDYYTKFMSVQYNGNEISSAQELRQLLLSSYRQGLTHLKLDYITYVSSTGLIMEENPLIILHSSSSLSSDPLFLSVFVITEEDLVNILLDGYLSDISYLCITDGRNQITLLDTFPDDFDASSYISFSKYSNYLGYTITLAVPRTYFISQLMTIVWILFTIILGAIISGIVFAVYYALKQYKGMSGILSVFDSREEGAKKLKGDFADIQQRILALKKEGESYKAESDELERQNQAIHFQNILIQGIRTDEDLDFISHVVSFACHGYFIAVIRVINGNENWNPSRLYDILQGSIFSNGITIHSGADDEIFILPTGGSEGCRDEIILQLEKLFQEEEHFILHAGISQISREAEDMPRLYEEAERAVISLYTYERESTYMFYEEEQRTSLLEIFNTETLSRLRNVLLSSQKSTAVAMIEDLFHRAEAFPLEAEERKNEIFYSLYNVYQSVFLALHIDSISIEKPLSSAPVSQMKQIFTDAAFRLCEITESNRKSHNEELRNRILSQIEDNYQDPGLSAYVISRKAGISEKYLTSFFREQMGTSFSMFLLTTRLMKAKTLLEKTDYSNEKIAAMTGFGSLNTFYRNFSKYFGLTPKAYKEDISKDQKNDQQNISL